MTIKVVPKYPVVAKNATWQKQKSFRDKLKKVTKTGLGTQLEAAEKAFGKIDFNKLDIARLQKATGQRLASYSAVDGAKQAAQRHLDGPVTVAHTALGAAVNKASSVSSNPALSTRATLAASAIAAALRKLAEAIDPANISLADFDAHKKELDAVAERAQITIKRLLPPLRSAAELVEDLPTVAGYTASGFHKQVVAVNTALGKSEDVTLKVWGQQNWAALAQPGFLPKQDGVVIKKVNQVLETLKELDELVG
ncbi:MAG: hypothetical protein ABI847_05070 [Anaerolineales bacterium]